MPASSSSVSNVAPRPNFARRLNHFRASCYLPLTTKMAGEEGFEPPQPVLETGGLPLNLLPFSQTSGQNRQSCANVYFTSLCGVCLRHDLQNLLVSSRSVCFFRFFVVV